MNRLYSRIVKEITTFFLPHECGFCKKEILPEEPLCKSCIELIRPTLSTRVSISSSVSVQIYALSAYEEPLKTLILGKHRSYSELSKHLGTLIWRLSSVSRMHADYLIPVPLHSRRQALRGYNHADVIAKQLSNLSGIPLLDCVLRVRDTKPQARCKSYERYANVKGAFSVSPNVCLNGKHLIIVDDLVTSGATIAEIARILIPHCPASMKALVACGQLFR